MGFIFVSWLLSYFGSPLKSKENTFSKIHNPTGICKIKVTMMMFYILFLMSLKLFFDELEVILI